MKLNFKKITAVAGAALLTGMTMGVAAAANFPTSFTDGGVSGVAVVYGANAAVSDKTQANNIAEYLENQIGTTAGGEPTGESYPLWTSGSKMYMNETLNDVKSILTDSELPTILEDSKFSGNVNADVTQTIKLGSNPTLVFGQHPTSDDDPTIALSLGTTSSNYVYNMTLNFDQAVNFTHSDSVGEKMNLFGKEYTVGADTTSTKLYLYESSEKIALSIGGTNPMSEEVTVEGETYTIELVTATDTSATIKVTNSAGTSATKTITEDDSKEVNGVDIAVSLADEDTATNRLLAEITVGTNKVLLQDGSEVKVGSDEDIIDGTNVAFTGTADALTAITIQVAAEDTDVDAITPGTSFVDPVFGTFSLYFQGMENDDNREEIVVKNSGNDKATVKFQPHKGDENTINWYYNSSASAQLADSTGDKIKVVENTMVNKSQYVVIGNEDEGYLMEVVTISNASDGYSDDSVKLRNAFDSSEEYDAVITSEGAGTVTIGGKQYSLTYQDSRTVSNDEYIRLNYPDSSSNEVVIYPTIQTSKGAKLAFYEPITFNISNWDGAGTDATALKLPDGDGYTDVAVADTAGSNISIASDSSLNATGHSKTQTIGQLTYNFTWAADTSVTVYLVDPQGGNIDKPALVIFEEQDDESNNYEAVIVEMEGAGTSTDGVGVNDVIRTWSTDATWDSIQLESDTDIYKEMDIWGTMITTDRSESDQYTATISYPDEQIFAKLYLAEGAGTTGTAGVMVYKDSETSSYAGKDIVVVGGSCINSAAASLLGGAYCGEAFTDETTVGTGKFLIQSFARDGGKVALLVAGYSADDTIAAAQHLISNPDEYDTTVGNKYVGSVVGTTASTVTKVE